jgi:hypothetical protein
MLWPATNIGVNIARAKKWRALDGAPPNGSKHTISFYFPSTPATRSAPESDSIVSILRGCDGP